MKLKEQKAPYSSLPRRARKLIHSAVPPLPTRSSILQGPHRSRPVHGELVLYLDGHEQLAVVGAKSALLRFFISHGKNAIYSLASSDHVLIVGL